MEPESARRASRETEDLVGIVVEGLTDYAIMTLDPAGHVISWNQGAVRLTGYQEDEILGRHFSRFFSPEDVATGTPERELEQAGASGRLEDQGWRVRKDGTRFWAGVIITPLRDEDGRLRGFVTLTHDMTERKQAEDALRSVATRLAVVLGNITDGFFTLDRELRYTDINVSGAKMVGRTPEQLIGRLLLDEFPQAADTPFVRAYRRVADTGEPCVVEDYYAPLNQWFEARVYPAPDGVSIFFTDVTERKRSERALRESQAQLQLISENVLDLVAQLGLDGTFVYVSPSYETVLGLPPGRVTGTSAFASVHPEDLEGVLAAFADTLHRGEGRAELRYRHAHGHYVWMDALGKVFTDAAGAPAGVVLTSRDITSRKQSEDQQRQSRDRFRTIFEEAPMGMALVDSRTGTICEANLQFAEIVGRTGTELASLDWMSITHPEDVQEDLSNMAQLNAGQIPGFTMRKRYRRADGSYVWVNMTVAPLAAEGSGQPQHVCMIEDITERRTADESLRLQSAALNAVADAIVITDRAGVIEWINPAFTELTGYAADEVLGQAPGDLAAPDSRNQAFVEFVWETLLAGRTWHGEVVNRRKDGSLYTEHQSVTPILNASGSITHFVAVKQDITERLLLEAQFRQAQKMESVGQLASGIAHDFNNLLTVINGMSDLVLGQVGPDDPVHADVEEIHRAGERAATLTRHLLAFSRQQILEPRVLNINTVVAGMESLLIRLLGEDVDLVVVPAPDVGNIKADPGQLEQVITNLAVNARDAMPQGGRLTIETQNVEFGEAYAHRHSVPVTAGAYVRLVVTDSGIGMDEAIRTRIFEPFFTTKGPGKGTGLGLSTVYGIVKQSQGFIWVSSEVGQGTSFTILLPRVSVSGPAGPAPHLGSSTGTESILLVEDNAALRRLATRLLEPAGYTVLAAATGEDALRLLESHQEPIHLLLSDVVMPGMSGPQLADRLARIRPGMKALYMSGYTDDTTVRHGVLEAQVPFLNKPFTATALLRKVREVLDSPA